MFLYRGYVTLMRRIQELRVCGRFRVLQQFGVGFGILMLLIAAGSSAFASSVSGDPFTGMALRFDEFQIAHSKFLAKRDGSGSVRIDKPDWPMWRYDAARSANAPHQLSEQLHLQWKRQLPNPRRAWPHQWDDHGKLDFDVSYSPVVMDELVFVPSNVTDSVTAYSIEDGAEKWRFYTDGPVRLAPAAYGGRLYFTSDDGYLYCLQAQSGELLWTFRGGPSDHRLLGNERIINFWPARGGPVVKDGTVYFTAGIWPLHGIFIYALDAESGDVVWVNDTTSSDVAPLPHGGAYGFGGLAPQGYIAAAGEELVVSGGRGPAGCFDRRTGQVVRINPRDGHKGGGGYGVSADGMGIERNSMLAERVETLSDQIGGEVFYKLAAYDRLLVTTTGGTIYCFGPEEVEPTLHRYTPRPLGAQDDKWNQIAEQLLDALGESEGYALMLGGGSGNLLRELLVQSELHVTVVEKDARAVRALRDELVGAGMYGRRAAVIQAEPATFSVQPYLFSLIVSEDAAAAGIVAEVSVVEPILNRLRPYGGIAWLGASWRQARSLQAAASEAAVDQVDAEARAVKRVFHLRRGTHLFARRGGPLTGAGQWTHQYHDAANTLMSGDQRVRLPLGVLWYGGPNNHNILPRHSGGPRPQVAGGRQVFLGVETIAARCVYTGRQLWQRQFPGIGHPFTNMQLEQRWSQGRGVYMTNIPGATYIGSPFVTLPDSVYLRYDGRIYRLDPATGQTLGEFSLPGTSVQELYDDENAPDWGHISVQGDFLVTTHEPHIFEDQDLGWTDSYSGTSSKRLVVMDRFDGTVLWQREAEIGFRHQAIVSAGNTLFVIDGLSENALNYLARRGQQPQEDSVIYALELKSGQTRWQADSEVFGTFLLYSNEHDILIEGGSQDLRRRLDDEPRQITARRGGNGEIIWQGGRFTLPATVHGEMLIPGRPGTARSIVTGQPWLRRRQHTDHRSEWTYRRDYGCNTLNASEHLLFYRTGYAGFYDLAHDTGTGTLSGVRSGCTANMIAADGVLNMLDYTRSCTCSYGLQTSTALIHMPDDSNIEFWTRHDAALPDPQRHGINFGAPGRRVSGSGVVWYDRDGTHRRHPSAIQDSGGSIDWVAASFRQVNGPIVIDELLETHYTIRLHFAELDQDISAGRRTFDVLINGTEVLSDFDIVAKTGRPFRATVQQFTVETAEGALNIELRKTDRSDHEPIINGIELAARHVAASP